MFLDYKQWLSNKDKIAVEDFDTKLQGIVRSLSAYHEQHAVDLSLDDLANIFFASRPKDKEFYQQIFTRLEQINASTETTLELINSVQKNKILTELALDAYDCSQGKVDLNEVLKHLNGLNVSEAQTQTDLPDYNEFLVTDLNEIVNQTYKKQGLRWRLNALNRMLGSLRTGDFGFIFARPETGKTTFLASEVTHMAEQMDKPVLWFNNEEGGNKVLLRCYQASLGVETVDLYRDIPGCQKSFLDRTKGNIRLLDSANISKQTVERLCKKYSPGLIVFDQIDKIQGFQSDREDLRLGAIYLWARELAKTYCPTIGVCQADGTGENVRWLTMQHVANAKTAKQAEADFILGIGKVNEPGFDAIRYLHASKNKLLGDSDSDGAIRHGRIEVLIDANRARYEDIQ